MSKKQKSANFRAYYIPKLFTAMQIKRIQALKPPPLASLKQISVQFGDTPVLENITLEIFPNSITTIVGPNGGGKSTLLKVLLKLIAPTRGQVIHQKNLKIGYVPQKLHLDNAMPLSVRKFLALKPNTTQAAINEALELFSIRHLAENRMQKLSGGELQRVLLARAILNRPQLLVLDEPMQGVDITGQSELYQLLNRTREWLNCAILMVSHDLNIVMANTDEVFCVNRHLCCAGTPEVVSTDPSFIHFFGDQFAKNVAFYSHRHNHHHDLHGDVCQGNCQH